MTITRVINEHGYEFELTPKELAQAFTEGLREYYTNEVEFFFEGHDELQTWRYASDENADRYNECVSEAVDGMLLAFERYDNFLTEFGIHERAWDALVDSGIADEIDI